MKNTPRIHDKNNPHAQAPQGKKPSIPGQKAASIGPAKPDIKGKVTLGAVRIGEAIGLSDKQIKALALLSEWERQTPAEYCKSTALGYLQASFDDMQQLAKANDRPKEKAWAEKFLPLVASLFPPASSREILADVPGRSPAQPGDKNTACQIPPALPVCFKAPSLEVRQPAEEKKPHREPDLCDAIRQSKALNQLLLACLDGESASMFRANNGYLAAGVQSLMRDSEEKIEAAYNASRNAEK